jgi:diacylglycerol kinase
MRATRELGRSFVYAFEGLLYTMHTQRNMRFHIFMAILVLAFNVSFSDYIPVDERALLLIVICLVPAFEIVNTSIESQADYVGADRHELIKRAKDTAAAAVLVMALTAMAVGGYVLLPNFIKFFRAPTPGRITSVGLRLIMSVTVGGSILVFWIFRSVKHLFFPTLVMASLAAGGTTAVMCIIGRDPSTAVALLFLCALELNAFARAEFEVRIHKEWVRPDLPFEVEGLKLIAPGLLLGFLGGAWVVWWGPFACYLAR